MRILKINQLTFLASNFFLLGLFFIHFLLPLYINQIGLFQTIYDYDFNFLYLFICLTAILGGFCFNLILFKSKIFDKKIQLNDSVNIKYRNQSVLNLIIFIFVVFWCFMFYEIGGLDYRDNLLESDFSISTTARIVNSLIYPVIVSSVYLFTHSKIRILKLLSIGLPLMLLALSNSRGITLVFFAIAYFYNALHNRKKIISVKNIIILLIIFTVFSYWGYYRDPTSESVKYSSLWRLSEPYWYWSFNNASLYHSSPSFFLENVSRLLEIPKTAFGIPTNYSIEGMDFYFVKFFGIEQTKGISLPLTLLGEGVLTFSFFGVYLFVILAIILIYLACHFIFLFSKIDSRLLYIFYLVFIARLLLIYSKTINGIILISFYENLRFLIIFAIFFKVSRVLSKSS